MSTPSVLPTAASEHRHQQQQPQQHQPTSQDIASATAAAPNQPPPPPPLPSAGSDTHSASPSLLYTFFGGSGSGGFSTGQAGRITRPPPSPRVSVSQQEGATRGAAGGTVRGGGGSGSRGRGPTGPGGLEKWDAAPSSPPHVPPGGSSSAVLPSSNHAYSDSDECGGGGEGGGSTSGTSGGGGGDEAHPIAFFTGAMYKPSPTAQRRTTVGRRTTATAAGDGDHDDATAAAVSTMAAAVGPARQAAGPAGGGGGIPLPAAAKGTFWAAPFISAVSSPMSYLRRGAPPAGSEEAVSAGFSGAGRTPSASTFKDHVVLVGSYDFHGRSTGQRTGAATRWSSGGGGGGGGRDHDRAFNNPRTQRVANTGALHGSVTPGGVRAKRTAPYAVAAIVLMGLTMLVLVSTTMRGSSSQHMLLSNAVRQVPLTAATSAALLPGGSLLSQLEDEHLDPIHFRTPSVSVYRQDGTSMTKPERRTNDATLPYTDAVPDIAASAPAAAIPTADQSSVTSSPPPPPWWSRFVGLMSSHASHRKRDSGPTHGSPAAAAPSAMRRPTLPPLNIAALFSTVQAAAAGNRRADGTGEGNSGAVPTAASTESQIEDEIQDDESDANDPWAGTGALTPMGALTLHHAAAAVAAAAAAAAGVDFTVAGKAPSDGRLMLPPVEPPPQLTNVSLLRLQIREWRRSLDRPVVPWGSVTGSSAVDGDGDSDESGNDGDDGGNEVSGDEATVNAVGDDGDGPGAAGCLPVGYATPDLNRLNARYDAAANPRYINIGSWRHSQPTESNRLASNPHPATGLLGTAAQFIIVRHGQLSLADGSPFRIVGLDAPQLMIWAAQPATRRLAHSLLASAAAAGLNTVRFFAFADGGTGRSGALQVAPGVLDEHVLREGLDWVVAAARRFRLRVIPVLTDGSSGRYGGMLSYIRWINASDTVTAFYTNDTYKALFFDYMTALAVRRNAYTGVEHRHDPTILAWDLANRPRDPGSVVSERMQAWLPYMANFLRNMDPNHLITVGFDGFFGSHSPHLLPYNPPAHVWPPAGGPKPPAAPAADAAAAAAGTATILNATALDVGSPHYLRSRKGRGSSDDRDGDSNDGAGDDGGGSIDGGSRVAEWAWWSGSGSALGADPWDAVCEGTDFLRNQMMPSLDLSVAHLAPDDWLLCGPSCRLRWAAGWVSAHLQDALRSQKPLLLLINPGAISWAEDEERGGHNSTTTNHGNGTEPPSYRPAARALAAYRRQLLATAFGALEAADAAGLPVAGSLISSPFLDWGLYPKALLHERPQPKGTAVSRRADPSVSGGRYVADTAPQAVLTQEGKLTWRRDTGNGAEKVPEEAVAVALAGAGEDDDDDDDNVIGEVEDHEARSSVGRLLRRTVGDGGRGDDLGPGYGGSSMEPSTTGAAVWAGSAEDDDLNHGADVHSEDVHGDGEPDGIGGVQDDGKEDVARESTNRAAGDAPDGPTRGEHGAEDTEAAGGGGYLASDDDSGGSTDPRVVRLAEQLEWRRFMNWEAMAACAQRRATEQMRFEVVGREPQEAGEGLGVGGEERAGRGEVGLVADMLGDSVSVRQVTAHAAALRRGGSRPTIAEGVAKMAGEGARKVL